MEYVKVELQKISIYLCCNTWIQSHQLHIITTCSVWGQACKQETWKQKLMQGSSEAASCPWDPAAQFCKVAIFQACTTASLSHSMVWSSSIWGRAAVEASFRLWNKGSRAESGSQNKPSWSWEHKTVGADSRVRGQGEPSAITSVPSSALPHKTSRQHFRYNAKSLAKQSSPEARKVILLFLDSETSPYLEKPS